jgi:hypothetical protein
VGDGLLPAEADSQRSLVVDRAVPAPPGRVVVDRENLRGDDVERGLGVRAHLYLGGAGDLGHTLMGRPEPPIHEGSMRFGVRCVSAEEQA